MAARLDPKSSEDRLSEWFQSRFDQSTMRLTLLSAFLGGLLGPTGVIEWPGLGLSLFAGQAIGSATQSASTPERGLSLDPGSRFYSLASRVDILSDREGRLTIQDVRRPGLKDSFQTNLSDRIHFPDASAVHWLRLVLDNPLPTEQRWTLYFTSSKLERIELYPPGALEPAKAGRSVPLAERDVQYATPSLRLAVSSGFGQAVYIRVEGKPPIPFRLQLLSEDEFLRMVKTSRLVLGLFFGVLIAIFCYNLLLLRSIKLPAFLYYLFYLASLGIYFVFDGGLIYEQPHVVLPSPWIDSAMIVLTGLVAFWIHQFFRSFLSLSRQAPRLDYIALGFMGSFLVCVVAAAAGWLSVSPILDGLMFSGGIFQLGLAIYFCIRRFRPAYYLTISFLFLFWGYSADLVLYHFPPSQALSPTIMEAAVSFLGRYALFIGTTLQMILLSLALSSLIFEIRRERERAKEEADRSQQLSRRLRSLDEVKSRFFANISHEFRTPLTLIRGPIEDLKEGKFGPLSERVLEQLDLSWRNSERLRRLIEQLFDLSRLEAGRLVLQAACQDVVAFLERMTSLFSSACERRNITLRFASEKPAIGLYFDSAKLETVVNNLFSNAIKFTQAGGRIAVSIQDATTQEEHRGAGAFVSIEVSDTGSGIHPEAIPFVFERFFQGGPPEGSKIDGTGIGLALAKELIELHGGRIEVESQIGKGSTFRLLLPKGADHLSQEEIVQAPAAEFREEGLVDAVFQDEASDSSTEEAGDPIALRGTSRPDILIVEDNSDLRAYVRRHLAPDYRIAEASNGIEALERIREAHPRLIVSDIMMPEMDGIELLRNVKRDPDLTHIPVVLLTARSDDADLLEGLESQADEYLIKPFKMEELTIRVRNLLAAHEKLRRRYAKQVAQVRPEELNLKAEQAEFLEKAKSAVEANLQEDDFGVEKLAQELYVSQQTLRRRLDALTAFTPSQFIRRIRLERARQLLESRAVTTVSEAAHSVGFRSAGYFARIYRKSFGHSPNEILHPEPPLPES